MVVNGILGGTLDIMKGGRLGGSGTVGTTTVGVGGSIAPGNSTGTLTVDGDITFEAGSTYEVESSSTGTDRIDVSGTASLAGEVQVDARPGSSGPIVKHTILHASDGVEGEFGTLSTNVDSSFFLTPSLSYDINNVFFSLQQTRSFPSVGRTRNQIATAKGIQSLDFGNAVFDAVLLLETAEQARAAFDILSGEMHASAASALIEDTDFIRDVVNDRIRAAFEGTGSPGMAVTAFGPEEAQGDGGTVPADASTFAWGTGFGGWGENDGDGNAASLDRSTAGFLAGGDALVAESFRLGLFAGYSRSSFDADERGSSGDSDNFHVGAYGGTQWGALGLRFGAAWSRHDVETGRSVAFAGFADSLSASHDASTTQLFGEAGYQIDTAVASFEPFAGLAYVHLDTDGFAEEGGPAALSGDGGSNDVTFTTLGVRASTGFDLADMQARINGAVGWRHAFGDVTPLATHAFAGSDAFTVAGTPIAEDALVLEAGIDLDLTDSATFGVAYDGQMGDGPTTMPSAAR
jgi:fibronectin-binding autotransporter adhesin